MKVRPPPPCEGATPPPLFGCGNRATHNLIHDCPRFGILFSGNNLLIEYNHIRHVNLETDDTGVVYTGGRDWISSRGTVIRHNFFHDSFSYGRQEKTERGAADFAWGIYLHDNAGGVDVIGNIVARCSRALVHLHNARDCRVENNIFVDGALQQFQASGWTPTHRYWTNHLPNMIKGYESVIGQPAWKQMRNMHIHPTNAMLANGFIMSGNSVCRNIFYYRVPTAKLYRLERMSLEHNRFDSNLVWHAGLPILTGHRIIKDVDGPNLVPHGDFEAGEPGQEPVGWRWQVRPSGSKAAIDDMVKCCGKRSLRIEGLGTRKDSSGRELFPNYVSADIPAQPGQWYRLRAHVRADTDDTKFAMMAQSYLANLFFWSRGTNATAGAQWKEYGVTFRFPSPGDHDWREPMKSFRIRFDIRQPQGQIWVDNVELREAVALDEWASWQALGQDTDSVVADPLFVNPDKDDYRLHRNSPAFRLGFKPIPVEKIGPYQHELRASWPIREAPGAREQAAANLSRVGRNSRDGTGCRWRRKRGALGCCLGAFVVFR